MTEYPICAVCGVRRLVTGEDERTGTCSPCRIVGRTAVGVPACAVCGLPAAAPEELPAGARVVCQRCQEGYGLPVVLPASRRPLRPCGRCSGPELVRAFLRERGASGGDYASAFVAPLGVCFAQREDTVGFFQPRKEAVHRADGHRPFGILEAWVCRACGYTELYALGPEEIPIGAEHGTELVVVGSGYR